MTGWKPVFRFLQKDYRAASAGIHQVPVDSDNSLVLESLQRFWKYQMTCAFALFETDNPKLSSNFTFLDRHHAIVFDL